MMAGRAAVSVFAFLIAHSSTLIERKFLSLSSPPQMIANVLIPATVVIMMIIVGAGLQSEQFKGVLRSPLPLIGGTLVQLLVLPGGAMLIVALLDPVPALAAGLLLVAACPGGALSNYYCHLGRLLRPSQVKPHMLA
jgi:predicted Na+-dependent transporter